MSNLSALSEEMPTPTSLDTFEELGRTATTQDSFVNFEQRMGVGADNALSSSTYGLNPISRQRVLLEWIHRGSWLGGIAVDAVADDMTRAGIDIRGDIDPKDISAIEECAVSLGIWKTLNETIKWSRLYGGAISVLLIDGQDLETPFRIDTISKGQFKGLACLDRWQVMPTLNDLVTEYGPMLGQPKYYEVMGQGPVLQGRKIHYSRCLRFEGITLPYYQRISEMLWGISVLERLYDRMISFDNATMGAAQLVNKAYLRTYKIKGMREIVAAGGDAMIGLTRYVDMMRRFQGIEGITLLDAEDDFQGSTNRGFAGISDTLQQFGQQISGALQIPLVRLFGQSPAGFASGDTDLRNYYDTIRQTQEKDLRTSIMTTYRLLAASEGVTLPKGTRFEFKPLWQLTEEQKAIVAEKTGKIVTELNGFSIIDKATALRELRQSSHATGIFTNITEEMIRKAETEEEIPQLPISEPTGPQKESMVVAPGVQIE